MEARKPCEWIQWRFEITVVSVLAALPHRKLPGVFQSESSRYQKTAPECMDVSIGGRKAPYVLDTQTCIS